MKKLVWVLTLTVSMQVCYGQTWNEWFRQRRTQLRYLLNQIAALQVYTDYLQKGYTIVKDGTWLIGDIKQGDFNLHNGYFFSLRSVNPAIRNYSRVAVILSDQATILRHFKELLKFTDGSGQFASTERQYISAVFANVKSASLQNLDDLTRVITSGEMEMKDDERIDFIDRIYGETKEQLSFTSSFCAQAAVLANQRAQAARESFLLKKLYGFE
ncbi:hypothetical protein [Longitalea luteola]|uniref:hypothetical protein n=1 Tax=Longitalea luteola TaxID=2812563 RepID=UPI001A972506|nr:hypothetical protein [Longitalea luteola]